ncbi:hypothetical protein A4A49_64074, partial [Nicotiana attenuata]
MHFINHDTLYPRLEIIRDKQNPHAQVLALKVHPPVIGAFPLPRKPLEASLDLVEWSTREMKDALDRFSGKATNMKVLLLKFFTHQK